jgi:hypothetical protein
MSLDYEVWLINSRGRPVRRPAIEVPQLLKEGFYQWNGPSAPKQTYYPQFDKQAVGEKSEKIMEETAVLEGIEESLDVFEI